MKIVSLNTWGGIAGLDNLLDFFKKNHEVDIFCLQEIFNGGQDDPKEQREPIESKVYDLLSRLEHAMPDYTLYFRPHLKDYFGLAIAIKKDLEVIEEGEVFVHKHKGYTAPGALGHHARNIQYVKLFHQGKPLQVINFHGLWNGQGKTDTDDRLTQSTNIVEYLKTVPGNMVLCGDFNLRPDTESIAMLENFGLRNLVKEYGITSTRTSHYTKAEKFADYAFVNPGLGVKDFRVLPDEVSDHAPLLIEI